MKRLKWVRRVWVILLFPAFLFGSGGCGYYHYSGSLQPMPEQSVSMQTDRAGVITHRENDLLIQLRAVSADELNQQFVTHSANGPESTNPYTFGDTRFWDGEQQRDRFTVYHLKVVNEGFPKVKIDPARVVMATDRGRQYWSLSLQQLDTYYRAYATGFRGNEYARYQERLDLLRRTMYKNEEVFDGQTIEGYLVFPSLHQDVSSVTVRVFDAVLRFDHRNEPQQTAELIHRFERETGRLYRDGRLVLDSAHR